MKSKRPHTPAPWTTFETSVVTGDGHNYIVADTTSREIAEFIVRAVNAHEDLMLLLEAARLKHFVQTDIPASLYLRLEALARA